jgi:beta-glucanase (GH16 family)
MLRRKYPAAAGHRSSTSPAAGEESGRIEPYAALPEGHEGNAQNPSSFFGTIHHWRRDPVSPNKMIHVQHSGSSHGFALPARTDFSQFHTYGMLWETERVVWYLDEQRLHSEPSYRIFDSQDYGLIIGMQVGKNWQLGNLEGVTAETMSLTVDWVRVWQE